MKGKTYRIEVSKIVDLLLKIKSLPVVSVCFVVDLVFEYFEPVNSDVADALVETKSLHVVAEPTFTPNNSTQDAQLHRIRFDHTSA